jgi:hypothetical protein
VSLKCPPIASVTTPRFARNSEITPLLRSLT